MRRCVQSVIAAEVPICDGVTVTTFLEDAGVVSVLVDELLAMPLM